MSARCPRCASRLVGRIGTREFFCRECCVQFLDPDVSGVVYTITDDGTLVPVMSPDSDQVAKGVTAR